MNQDVIIRRTSPHNAQEAQQIAQRAAHNGTVSRQDRVLTFNKFDYGSIVYAFTQAKVHWRHVT